MIVVESDGTETVVAALGNTIEINTINAAYTRVDGLADNCGNPPPYLPTTPPPGVDSPVPDDIIVGPPGAEINIPVSVGFGAVVVNVNGSLNVGFNIVNPDFEITGELNLNTGDINFNFGGRGPGNEECCLPPVVDDDDTGEEGGDDDDETEQRIVGVIVNSVVDGTAIKATEINQDNGPTIYNPRLANVYFRLRINGQIFFTEPIRVRHDNQYIQCPANFGAVAVVASPIEGVSLRLSPVRRKIPVSEFP